MKKRIISLLLAVILCTSFTGVHALAEGNMPQMTIVGQNLALEDSIYIKYYVNCDGAENVRLLVWTQPQTAYEYGNQSLELNSTGTATVTGRLCNVYEYKGLVAKEMAKDIYVRAYSVVNGQACYSSVKKYSVLTYVYNKLGKTGTATTDQNLIRLLELILQYGAAAQTYLNYQTNRLVTQNYYQVKLANGVLDDQCKTGLYLPGDTVNINAPATDADGKIFDHWENSVGTKVASTNRATVTVTAKNEVYTAVYAANLVPSVGLEFSARNGVATLKSRGDCEDSAIVIPDTYNNNSVQKILTEAFMDDVTLTAVTLPTSIISIGEAAFYGCSNLTDIYFLGTTAEWNAITMGEDAIPAGVTIHCNDPEVSGYAVTFKDYDGTVLKTETVVAGGNATFPAAPTRSGYVFLSWKGNYVNVQADSEVVAQYEAITAPVIVIGSGEAKAGDQITVNIDLRNNPGIATSILKINYDASILTLDSYAYGAEFAKDGEEPGKLTSPVTLTWSSSTANVSGDETYVSLTFTVNANAQEGAKATIGVESADIINFNENDVIFLVRNGTVTVR